MDYRSDFQNAYYATISKEENHSRTYCVACGRSRKRSEQKFCKHCPGLVCESCQPWHDQLAEILHRRPTVQPIVVIENPLPVRTLPPEVPHVPRWRQRRLAGRPGRIVAKPKNPVPKFRQTLLFG